MATYRRRDGVISCVTPGNLRLTAATLALCAVISQGCAQKPRPAPPAAKSAAPAAPKLPARAGGFTLDAKEKPRVFSAENLWEHADGGAPEIIRLGFVSLVVANYTRPGGGEVTVEAYFMKSPDAASALFETMRSKKLETESVCGVSQTGPPALIWRDGSTYAHLNASFEGPDVAAALESIARDLCKPLASK